MATAQSRVTDMTRGDLFFFKQKTAYEITR